MNPILCILSDLLAVFLIANIALLVINWRLDKSTAKQLAETKALLKEGHELNETMKAYRFGRLGARL